jgi:hypothetical protein
MFKMKNLRFKPFGPILIGLVVVYIGAMLKIMKMSFSQPLLIAGLLIELFGIIYFIYRYRIMRKNEKLLLTKSKTSA